jgi:hypothetical protein
MDDNDFSYSKLRLNDVRNQISQLTAGMNESPCTGAADGARLEQLVDEFCKLRTLIDARD